MGYNFRSSLNLQVQTKPSIREISASRFAITTGSNGAVTVTTTRAATLEEQAARRQSARESGGLPRQIEEVGDYASLPSSKRDVFLTGSHGLTSLYPAILLTSPRTSKIVDLNSGLTATPFIIDLNNQVKKTVETSVKSAIDVYTPILSLTNNDYNQSLNVANKYADFCLQAALQKDRIIELTNIINAKVTSSPNQSQNIVIDGREYQFLNNFPDVISFMKNIDDRLKLETFTEGNQDSVNTKSFVQVLKILYNQFLIGNLEIGLSSTSNTYLLGSVDYYINNTLKSVISVGNDFSIENIDSISHDEFKNTDRLIDLVRIVQRDLIIQSSQTQMTTIAGQGVTGQDVLSNFIGKYKDQYQRSNTFLSTGSLEISDFTQNETAPIRSILVKDDMNSSFNVLDVVKGHDYLLYEELAKETNSVNLDNLISFSNSYAQFSLKLHQLYQAIFRDDQTRQKCLSIIASNFLSFFTSTQVTQTEFTSKSSAARTAALMAAAMDQSVSTFLFNLICKQARNEDNDDLRETFAFNVFYGWGDGLNNDNLRVNGSTADGGGYYRIRSDYFKGGPGTSFGMFHAIAQEIENALASENLQNNDERNTTFSLNLTRDARAFVFYQLFLDIIRNFYFDIDIRDITYKEFRIRYKPEQYKSIKFALENFSKGTEEFNNAVNSYVFSDSNNESYQEDARLFYSKYLAAITRKINDQEQNCLDIVNLFINHSAQFSQATTILKSSIDSIKRILADNAMLDKESVLNAIQTEQASLKKNIVNRYSNVLRGATYLPSAIDHNYNQALNTKTVVSTLPVLNDPIDESLTRKFLIAVGMPSGLLESLRYQNSISTSEHLYSIDLVFKNLQIDQSTERFFSRSNLDNYYVTKSYTFSSRIFVNEGYQLADGADVKANQLSNYEQIYAATKYKVIDDDGLYRDATPDDLAFILGGRTVLDNHLTSHYSKLLLKTTTGITLDEEAFDLVPQTRQYPDTAQEANYTTIVDRISINYPDTAEGNLNKERALRDLSRAIVLAPQQHKTSMMISKTFERIHVIPIDISSVLEELQISNSDICFIDVVAKIRLEDNQPPISFNQSPTRRSYSQASNDVFTTIGQTDARSQSASSVGLNAFVETSKKFSGMLGGR